MNLPADELMECQCICLPCDDGRSELPSLKSLDTISLEFARECKCMSYWPSGQMVANELNCLNASIFYTMLIDKNAYKPGYLLYR